MNNTEIKSIYACDCHWCKLGRGILNNSGDRVYLESLYKSLMEHDANLDYKLMLVEQYLNNQLKSRSIGRRTKARKLLKEIKR